MNQHLVQFYDKEAFLIDEAIGFVDEGQRVGDTVIVIATGEHLREINERLKQRHALSPAASAANERFIGVDAGSTLAQISVDGWPDEQRFAEVIGGLVADASDDGRIPVRVFAEMVAVLCAAGNPQAALHLEQLWNRLAAKQPLALRCAYPMNAFADTEQTAVFGAICAAHTQVFPCQAAADAPVDADELRRTIASLQRRIVSLERDLAGYREVGKLAEKAAVDMAAMALAYSDLERVANLDPLTGLYNRRVFVDRLEHALERAKRRRTSFALLLVDLDDFKRVNDRLGHEAGDRLLREVAVRLGHCARGSDTVCRLGGDEFTVIMEDCSLVEAKLLAQRVVESLDQEMVIDGEPVLPTASVGVGIYPDDAADAATLIRSADQAMYRAKGRGKARYEDSGVTPLV